MKNLVGESGQDSLNKTASKLIDFEWQSLIFFVHITVMFGASIVFGNKLEESTFWIGGDVGGIVLKKCGQFRKLMQRRLHQNKCDQH